MKTIKITSGIIGISSLLALFIPNQTFHIGFLVSGVIGTTLFIGISIYDYIKN